MADLGPDPCHNQYLHGLFNITTPQMVGPHGPPTAPGPTLLVGMPMFCGVDEAVRRGVVGLECDPKKHLVYIDVEPLTGGWFPNIRFEPGGVMQLGRGLCKGQVGRAILCQASCTHAMPAQ